MVQQTWTHFKPLFPIQPSSEQVLNTQSLNESFCAIARHKPNTSNLMFHSDQGTQYSSKAFIDYCNQNNIAQSMSRKGNCWNNAVMERFFRSLKTERLNYQSFANHYEVVLKITVRNTLINISVLISSVFILITPL
jgi:transposase InsO family protein